MSLHVPARRADSPTRPLDPLDRHAADQPDAPALIEGATIVTWAQLRDRAEAVAAALRERGLGRGDVVALLAGASIESAILVHGVHRAGLVLAPLNVRGVAPEIAAQLTDTGAVLLLHDAGHAELARAAAAGIEGLVMRSIGDLASVDAPSTGAPSAESPSLEAPEGSRQLDLERPAVILFTSGTTGRPKGAVLTLANLAASARAWASILEPQPDDRWLLALPIHHIAGLSILVRGAIWGVPVVIHERFDPQAADALLDDGGISHLSVVPQTLERLLDARQGRPWPASLRAILLGGAASSGALLDRALASGAPILPSYGMTETGSGICALRSDEIPAHPGSSGRPLAGVSLAIELGEGEGGDGPGAIGEILVRGPMVFAGYLQPETGEVVDMRREDGWFATGDLASIDDDGYLTVVDRRDDLVISGGENVYPAEVEAVLAQHPAVEDVAVVGRPDVRWGSVPVAAVVLRDRPATDEAELRAFVRERLAPFKVPAAIVPVPSVPRSASGKLVHRELRALFDPAQPRAAARHVPGPKGGYELRHERIVRPGASIGYIVASPAAPGAAPGATTTTPPIPLLVLHAAATRAWNWRGLFPLLAEERTIIAVDRRAHRNSPCERPLEVTVDDHIADVLAILEREGASEVIVVSHSYGGCLGVDLAARHPDLVKSAVAYEPPYMRVGDPDACRRMRAACDLIVDAHRQGGCDEAARVLLRELAGVDDVGKMRASAYKETLKDGSGAAADANFLGFRPQELGRIRAPFTFVVGERDPDQLPSDGSVAGTYLGVARGLVEQIPGARLALFPHAAHLAPIQVTEQFLPFVRQAIEAAEAE